MVPVCYETYWFGFHAAVDQLRNFVPADILRSLPTMDECLETAQRELARDIVAFMGRSGGRASQRQLSEAKLIDGHANRRLKFLALQQLISGGAVVAEHDAATDEIWYELVNEGATTNV